MKKIAIQGTLGSYHDIAAHKYFEGEEIELICCANFEDVFTSIRKDSQVIGMLAIENTIAGSLLHNNELLRQSGTQIIGEYKLRISHSFVCLPDENWAAATPVGIGEPRALQYWQERGKIPNFKKCVRHNVGVAPAQEHVPVTIAPCARDCRGIFKSLPLLLAAQARTIARVGSQKRYAFEFRFLGGRDFRPVKQALFAIAYHALVQDRLVYQPKHRLPVFCKRYERSEEGNGAYKRFCSVNRVYHPYVFGVFVKGAVLLANYSVVGEFFLYRLAQHVFRIFIHLRHGGIVFFEIYAVAAAERLCDVFAAHVGEFVNKNLESFALHGRNV